MNSQWHCYHPGGNSSLAYPYHITVLGGRGGPWHSRICHFKGLYSHPATSGFWEGKEKLQFRMYIWICYYITSLFTLTNHGWLSLSTIKHTFPSSPFTNMYTYKPLHRVCLDCKCQNAVKKIEIWKLPRILIIILNRWVLTSLRSYLRVARTNLLFKWEAHTSQLLPQKL